MTHTGVKRQKTRGRRQREAWSGEKKGLLSEHLREAKHLRDEMAGCEAEHGPVTVFYCCGFDHYMKCGLYRGMR